MKCAIVLLPLLMAATAAADTLEVISSAEICGSCHRAIHEAWKRSAHAAAMESRLFQDALEMAEREFGAESRKACLRCHSPLAVHLGDWTLKQKVSWEGVTCDYCHSVRDVKLAGPNPAAVTEFSLVKTGPIKDAQPLVHGARYSDVHVSSSICAPCHQYRNANGLDVLTTFSEWRNSRYHKEKVQCQACHMGRVEGDVVDPRIKASAAARVNLHEMPGSHSVKQLNQAVRTALTTARKADQLEVAVQLINSGAGHYVPTGSPMREVVLEVTADAYEGQDFSEERRYGRLVADAEGKPVTGEHAAFFRGAKVLSDTRLAPDEKRTETFRFAIPDRVPVQVTARLSYYYSPLARKEAEKRIVFQTISRFVK
jgi:cytochrome c551/c552